MRQLLLRQLLYASTIICIYLYFENITIFPYKKIFQFFYLQLDFLLEIYLNYLGLVLSCLSNLVIYISRI